MSTWYPQSIVDSYFAKTACWLVYNRGTSSYPARPTSPTFATVVWTGPVQPSAMALGDHWVKTAT